MAHRIVLTLVLSAAERRQKQQFRELQRDAQRALRRAANPHITIDAPGMAKFLGRLSAHKVAIENASTQAIQNVADDIVIAAKDFVAVDTGRTRDFIRRENRGKFEVAVVSDRGGERDEVPIYLEIGTFKMAARPFMKPAADMVMAAGGFNARVKLRGGLLGPVRRIHM